MSETVHYRGTLNKVKRLNNETLEEQCKRLLENQELKPYYDTYHEMLLDEYYQKYIEHDGNLYSIDRHSVDCDEDIFNISKNKDGNFNFEVKYYNGGCGFHEAIEEAFQNYKKSK